MLRLGMLVIIGALTGTALRFSGFAFVGCAVLIVYAILDWERAFLPLAADLVLAAVALQVGYFLSILVALTLQYRRGKRF
jgi:hypothetical protein